MVYKKSTPISAKQRRIARAHVTGHSNPEIGTVEYPNASRTSQRQLVYKMLKKPVVKRYLEQTKLQALKKYDITWDRIVKVISESLDATKISSSSERLEDFSTRLRAAKQAIDLMEPKKETDVKGESDPELMEQLTQASDEIELQRLLFRRGK